MSKKNRRRLALTGFILWFLLASLGGQYVTAQKAAPAVTPDAAKRVALTGATDEVLKETSELRQLPVLRPIKSAAQSRADIERMVIKSLDEDNTPEKLKAAELTLKHLGLVPADFQYRPFVIGLLTEQVAGYYDPKAQMFYLADWIALEGQTPVMAHELTHALQDQHFNLKRFQKWRNGDSDAELAAHSLIEGDATLTMMQYILHKPNRLREFMTSMGGMGALANEKIESAPRALRETLLFPYDQGTKFATRVFARGGWKLISQAFTDLPKSTEQILHAEKYFEHEAPLPVELPDVRPLLGKGWRRAVYDVNGEWSYYLILDEYLKSTVDSAKAAAGWGGDRYAVYVGPKNEVMMAQLTVWDTEADANEFYASYLQRTKLRYKSDSAIEITASIHKPMRQATIETKDGKVLIAQSGTRVLMLEGVPASVNINTLRGTLIRSGK